MFHHSIILTDIVSNPTLAKAKHLRKVAWTIFHVPKVEGGLHYPFRFPSRCNFTGLKKFRWVHLETLQVFWSVTRYPRPVFKFVGENPAIWTLKRKQSDQGTQIQQNPRHEELELSWANHTFREQFGNEITLILDTSTFMSGCQINRSGFRMPIVHFVRVFSDGTPTNQGPGTWVW